MQASVNIVRVAQGAARQHMHPVTPPRTMCYLEGVEQACRWAVGDRTGATIWRILEPAGLPTRTTARRAARADKQIAAASEAARTNAANTRGPSSALSIACGIADALRWISDGKVTPDMRQVLDRVPELTGSTR
jgi:hypothetical protein